MSIGLPLKRVDAEAKVTGSARYTDDNIMLGMRHAKYVRSNIAHGKVLAIDATEALALHGVEAQPKRLAGDLWRKYSKLAPGQLIVDAYRDPDEEAPSAKRAPAKGAPSRPGPSRDRG